MYSTYESGFAGPPQCEARPSATGEDHHPRRRPEPHRPGHRVRLLLLPRRLLAVRRGLRDHHGQLQSGDGVDRLRHLGPPLFRAAHRRGRARDRAQRGDQRKGQGRHRAVRRPDAAEARPSARGREGADPRHLARRHRPCGRPRQVQGADRSLGPAPAEKRHRPLARRSCHHRRHAWLPARHPPVLCAGRQGDGDRARRCAACPLYLRGRGGVGQEPGAARHLSPRRHRSRRRRHRRRQGRLHLRGYGAYRRGRRPFRRLGLLAAAAFAEAGDCGGYGAADGGARPRAERGRADECAVRHPERRDLCARGESAGLAHGALRRQGDRPTHRRHRRRR